MRKKKKEEEACGWGEVREGYQNSKKLNTYRPWVEVDMFSRLRSPYHVQQWSPQPRLGNAIFSACSLAQKASHTGLILSISRTMVANWKG